MAFDNKFLTNPPVDKVNAAKAWLSGAGSSLASGAGSLLNKATGTATDIGKAFGKSFSDAKGMVTDQIGKDTKTLKKSTPWIIAESNKDYKDLFPIGRPCKFNITIDPHQRFGNYLRSKMSVIDLIPVDHGVDLKNVADVVSGKTTLTDIETGKISSTNTAYSIGYTDQIKKYQRLCDYHGLKQYPGLRLFTTDDTTSSDTVSVQYKDSTFQGAADTLSGAGQTYRDAANLVLGSNTQEFNTKLVSATTAAVGKGVNVLGGNDGIRKLFEGVAGAATDMALNGNKMTFPKIWQSSTYHNNLSVNIRLVSPYGHPKAVKEFIMKPLSYLMLLAAPQTINGITYGGSIPITIKAYGLNYTVVGSIASMTFRRGGSDTSFNLYRQPLTVDVSIEFQTLFDAFAMFDPTSRDTGIQTDRNIFKDSNLIDPGSLNLWEPGKNNLMQSLGTILASLRPVRIVDMGIIDPQVYGIFTAPDRTQIPEGPSFIPLAGNLGSTISNAVASIGNFANMVTNAPKLIQQGLSNAVYNTAKGSVASIAGTASGWINKPVGIANSIRTKITGNLF